MPHSIIMMAMTITLHNIENLVLENSEIRRKLVAYKALFHTWALSRQSSSLKSMGQKVAIEILDKLTDKDLAVISEVLGEDVKVEKINHNVVEHYNCLVDKAEKVLNANPIIKEAFFAYREGDALYVSFWR